MMAFTKNKDMPNIFESLKAQKDAAKAAEEAAAKKQLELMAQQNRARFRPIIDEKQKIEDNKLKTFNNLAPTITKVLRDLGSLLGKEYTVHEARGSTQQDGYEHWPFPSYEDESGQYHNMPSNTSYFLQLGRNATGPGTYHGGRDDHPGDTYFDVYYSVGLVFSEDQLLRLECVNRHSGVFVKKSPFSHEEAEKPVAPITCGFSEDEIANALHRLEPVTKP